jgi:hypothetical protein
MDQDPISNIGHGSAVCEAYPQQGIAMAYRYQKRRSVNRKKKIKH